MPSEELTAEYAAGTLIFPPSVGLDPDRHIVLVAPFATEGALPRGARMVSVNGDDADSLAHAWTAETSGESERYRLANVASSFRTLMLVHGIHAPYVVVIADSSGATRTATLPGITQDSLVAQVRVNRVQRVPGTDFTYRVLQPTHSATSNFRSMRGDVPPASPASIAAMFRSVAADSDSTLIVDLRSNGGGDSRLADEFLRHITTASYRLDALEGMEDERGVSSARYVRASGDTSDHHGVVPDIMVPTTSADHAPAAIQCSNGRRAARGFRAGPESWSRPRTPHTVSRDVSSQRGLGIARARRKSHVPVGTYEDTPPLRSAAVAACAVASVHGNMWSAMSRFRAHAPDSVSRFAVDVKLPLEGAERVEVAAPFAQGYPGQPITASHRSGAPLAQRALRVAHVDL